MMGRVSRHKRVKSFDPFSRRRISLVDPCKDNDPVPAEVNDEQPLPKSLKTFLRERDRTRKRRKRKALAREDIPDTDNSKDKGQSCVFKRQKGETKRSYFDRMDRETMAIVHKHKQLTSKTGQRRKKYMEAKESKRQSKKQEAVEEKLLGFNQLQGQELDLYVSNFSCTVYISSSCRYCPVW
jgi:hypothetical protein